MRPQHGVLRGSTPLVRHLQFVGYQGECSQLLLVRFLPQNNLWPRRLVSRLKAVH